MGSNLEMQLNNNPITYRDVLTIPRKVNFGLEFELDKINPDLVYKLVRRRFNGDWEIKDDRSLTTGMSCEISSPVLNNSREVWILLKKLGEILESIKPNYERCSFQVNFDGSLLPSNKDKVRFLKLYAIYEDLIYRFSQGEDDHYRGTLEIYAAPIILSLKGVMKFDDEELIEYFSNNKRNGIVFKNDGRDLIEFRTPNMTSNPTLWQNYITTFYYLVMYARSGKINERELDEYINKFCKIYLLEFYEKCNVDKAVEFSNKVFSKKLDKMYFLQQYIKRD